MSATLTRYGLFACLCLMPALLFFPVPAMAQQPVMCPDGSYVDRGPCTLCPNGSYIGSGGQCRLTPDGNQVRQPPSGAPPRLTPGGGFIEGGRGMTLCPNGQYVSGRSCRLMPDGSYIGVQ